VAFVFLLVVVFDLVLVGLLFVVFLEAAAGFSSD
jgi:hypothetical protein